MADVFISYAREDRETARKLAGVLEAKGWSVWWDRKIIAGQSFDQVIERELETAKAAVVLWSKDSVASEWVKNEAAAAAEKGVLVPVLIENVKVPLEFRRKQTVDLAGWDGDETHSGLQALYEGISAAVTGVAPPQPIIEPSPPKFQWRRSWTFVLLAVIVVVVGFAVYRAKPWQDRHVVTVADRGQPSDRADVIRQLSEDQRIAMEMFAQRKPDARERMEQNLIHINNALKSFPDDTNLNMLMGYTLKTLYQGSKGVDPPEKRREYLSRAKRSFEQALRLNPKNAGAHNGMGNVLFFEGNFDEAVKEHDTALRLTGGNYPAAEQDKQLVLKVRDGKIPFNF
ncbi:MAG: TIR domain-containing protein [Syntrophaceae bacterium]